MRKERTEGDNRARRKSVRTILMRERQLFATCMIMRVIVLRCNVLERTLFFAVPWLVFCILN